MTWNRYGKGGWNNLGPMIAMMAASAANEWEDGERRRPRRSRGDWRAIGMGLRDVGRKARR